MLAAVGKALTPALGADGDQRGQLAGDGRHVHRHLRQGDGGRHPECALRQPRPTAGRSSGARTRAVRPARPALAAAFATIPANLAELADAVTDPLGLTSSTRRRPRGGRRARRRCDAGTFGAMASRFDGQLGAFAYLLAVLLYMPCVSAIAAIQRETGWRWTIFACALDDRDSATARPFSPTRRARFARNPTIASAWIAGIVAVVRRRPCWPAASRGRGRPQPATAS